MFESHMRTKFWEGLISNFSAICVFPRGCGNIFTLLSLSHTSFLASIFLPMIGIAEDRFYNPKLPYDYIKWPWRDSNSRPQGCETIIPSSELLKGHKIYSTKTCTNCVIAKFYINLYISNHVISLAHIITYITRCNREKIEAMIRENMKV